MHSPKSSVLFIALLLAVPSANAASKTTKIEGKESAAKRACLNGDPLRGVQILTDLYILSKDPTYLYNQGRCFEQNNRYEEAVGRFREYLRKLDSSTTADQANSQSARKHIADCEALLGRKLADPDRPAPPPESKPEPQPEPIKTMPPPPPPPMVTVAQPQPASASSNGSGLRTAGVLTAAVGGAALVTGLILNLKANSMVGDLENRFDKGSYSSSKDYKTMSQVSYGVGAACVVGGAILYYLGVKAGNQVALAPLVERGLAGAVLTGAF